MSKKKRNYREVRKVLYSEERGYCTNLKIGFAVFMLDTSACVS